MASQAKDKDEDIVRAFREKGYYYVLINFKSSRLNNKAY
jgi:hypothetical protein